MTYDEEWHATYGDHVIRWYTSGFADRSALTYFTLMQYGAFADVVLNLGARVLPFGLYESRHLLTAAFAVAGLVGAWRLASHLAGPRAGFLALLLLALAPRYAGEAFQNNKDVPFAAMGILFLDRLVRCLPSLPRVPARDVAMLGVLFGLLVGIRIGGLIFAVCAAVPLAAWAVCCLAGRLPCGDGGRARALGAVIAHAAVVGAIAYLVMLAWWPAAQADLLQPARALRWSLRFDTSFKVWFDGEHVLNSDLPWSYLPRWLLYVTPEAHLVALAAGAVAGAVGARRALASRDRQTLLRALGGTAVAAAIVVPVGYVVVTRPTTYDGIRHFLFVLPPMAVAGAIGLDALMRAATSSAALPRALSAACVALATVSLAATVSDMVRLHPYQYVYFNRLFAGGMSRAAQRFDTDYWGASLKEAVEWLAANAPEAPDGERPRVASTLYPLSTTWFLPADRFEYVGSFHEGPAPYAEPDYLIASPRWGGHRVRPGRVIHVVERCGAPLSYVIEVGHSEALR